MRVELSSTERELRQTVRSAIDGVPTSDLWATLCRLGVVDFAVPSWAEGFDLGQAASVQVASVLGRRAECTPYLSTVFAVECLANLGQSAGGVDLLREMADGKRVVSAIVPRPGRPPRPRLVRTAGGLLARGATGPACHLDTMTHLLFVGRTEAEGAPVLAIGVIAELDRAELATIVLSDAPVEVVATPPQTSAVLGDAVARARVRQAAYLLGLASRALDEARRHVTVRRQFGSALVEYQSIRFKLATLLARLTAAEYLVRDAVRRQDDGDPAHTEATRALAMAAELAFWATREAVHLHGARGLVADTAVAACYRTAGCEAPRLGASHELWRETAVLGRSANSGERSEEP